MPLKNKILPAIDFSSGLVSGRVISNRRSSLSVSHSYLFFEPASCYPEEPSSCACACALGHTSTQGVERDVALTTIATTSSPTTPMTTNQTMTTTTTDEDDDAGGEREVDELPTSMGEVDMVMSLGRDSVATDFDTLMASWTSSSSLARTSDDARDEASLERET